MLKSDCMSDLAYLKSCLPVQDTAYLQQAYYRYTQSGQKETGEMLTRISLFEAEFDHALLAYDIPQWIKYLPLAESRLLPQAFSPAGAAGLWQIMPATGRGLGLKINAQTDERLHTRKASYAAAKYLKQLHTQFGDWLLALAAYNCGAGNVRKAQRRAKGYFYHEISDYLPKQTQRYIPRVLTIATIAEHPILHGFSGQGYFMKDLIPFSCQRSTDIHELASYFSCSTSKLRHYNPASLDGKFQARNGATALIYIPAELTSRASYHRLMRIGYQLKQIGQGAIPSIYPSITPAPVFATIAQEKTTWDWLLAFKLINSPSASAV